MNNTSSGVVCVMPRRSDGWVGAAAMWVTAAGWAGAASERLGASWVVTPDAVAGPEEVLGYVDGAEATRSARVGRPVPTVLRTAVKDARQFVRQRRFSATVEPGPWDQADLRFVWQHHDLFHRAGRVVADRSGVPLVSFVHAPQVWEARKWGVRRPGWSALLERVGERPQLVESDLVACVSAEVVDAVVELGVARDRTVVTPMGVDPDRFHPGVDAGPVRALYGLEGCFVVGWVGSFRRFHGLGVALEGFAELAQEEPSARLLLVGDGAERARLETRAAELGISDSVVFAGRVAHGSIPGYVAAMDVALVTGQPENGFHYSPLKLREYLAAGRPTVAPALGEVGREFSDGTDLLTYEPGQAAALAHVLRRLAEGRDLRASLARSARDVAVDRCTWAAQLERVLTALDDAAGSDP